MKNERLEALRKRIAERPPRVRVEQSQGFYLGWYIGEFITSNFLPCLSCDNNTLRPVQISDEEQSEYNKLSEDLCIDRVTRTTEGWDKYISYRKILKKKYLPETLKCYVPNFVSDDMEEVKRGIRESLWDSDVCSYQISKNEDIEIGEDPGEWCQRRIILKLSEQD